MHRHWHKKVIYREKLLKKLRPQQLFTQVTCWRLALEDPQLPLLWIFSPASDSPGKPRRVFKGHTGDPPSTIHPKKSSSIGDVRSISIDPNPNPIISYHVISYYCLKPYLHHHQKLVQESFLYASCLNFFVKFAHRQHLETPLGVSQLQLEST